MKGNPATGFNYLLRGLQLAMKPGLRVFIIVPLLLNTVIFSLLIYLSLGQFSDGMAWLLAKIPDWLAFIRFLLWPLIVALLLVLVMYSFSIIANLIASPFNGLLCEKAEELVTGKEVAGYETFTAALLSFPKSIARELQKILYYLPWALALTIISFIPAVNVAAPVLWFLLGAWMMAIQYCDYPMDTHRRSFSQMKFALRQHRMTSLGFGAATMIGTMIPIVNFVVMPAAVCGATLFWIEQLRRPTDTPARIDPQQLQ